MYALDTNTVLDSFKGKGDVAANLLATPPGEVALPAVAAHEVWAGVLGSQNATRRRAVTPDERAPGTRRLALGTRDVRPCCAPRGL